MDDHGHNRQYIRHGWKEGVAVPLSRGEGAASPSNTMWPGPRSTSVPSGIFIHPAVWPQQTWAENWLEGAVPFFLGGAGSASNRKSPGLRPTSVPNGILVHPAVWPQQTWAENWGGCAPLFSGGELGQHLAQCGLDQGPPPCQVPSWSIQPFGHKRHGPKIGWELCPLFGEGELGPHLTQSCLGGGLPPYQVAS